MRRGEVWWVEFLPPTGRRPALLLTRDDAYGVRTSITVAPITRTQRGIPVEVRLTPADGMSVNCVVSLDDITTVPTFRILNRMTELSAEKMDEVADAIAFALDLPFGY